MPHRRREGLRLDTGKSIFQGRLSAYISVTRVGVQARIIGFLLEVPLIYAALR
jgi:hypothetical protein